MSKITKCRNCQADLAASAKYCLSCGAENKKPIYKQWWMWVIVAAGMWVIAVVVAIGTIDIPSDDSFSVSSNTGAGQIVDSTPQPTSKDVKQQGKGQESDTGESEIIDVDYVLLWNNYNDEAYKDQNIRIAGKIDYLGTNTINIKEGLSGITGNIYLKFEKSNTHQLKSVSEDDYIIVTGKCTGKAAGQVSIEKSNIESVGDQALQKVNEYKKIAEETAAQQTADYKAKAKTITYENLVREPDKYKGEIITVTIKISQIMGGGIFTESGYRGNQNSDEWYINYELPEGSPRILEQDTVKFYGEFVGVTELTRALTKTKAYVPKMKAQYFDLVK